MFDLAERFSTLNRPNPTEAHHFNTFTVSNALDVRVGKDCNGNPVLLLKATAAASSSYTIELEHLVVQYGVDSIITDEAGQTHHERLSLVRMQNATSLLKSYFLDIAEVLIRKIGADSSEEVVAEAIRTFVQLFRKLTQPSRRSVQGLWGELFVIASAADPDQMLHAWHAEPEGRFDFSMGPDRLEVKTTSTRERVHHFSLEQLQPPGGSQLLIASMFCEQVGSGISSGDLVQEIRGRVSSPDLLLKLDRTLMSSLGESFESAMTVHFDQELASESLRFYDFQSVPRIHSPLPHGVTKVSFSSDLSTASHLSKTELNSLGGLYAIL